MGFEWLRPGALWVAAFAVIPLIFGVLRHVRVKRALLKLCEPRHLRRVFPGLLAPASLSGDSVLLWLRRRALYRAALGATGIALMALALIGPVRGYALVPAAVRQVDVVVVLDTSRSMWVEDVEPNRIERAKTEIVALLDTMRGERAGLIAFAGDARSVAPLTRDMDTMRYFLQRLTPEDNRKGGTDIGGALRVALERFEESPGGGTQSIVLVTDGEDLSGDGLAAAEDASSRGITVHVLGMGTPTGGKIPNGAGQFVVDNETREEVVSKLESKSLKAIAQVTGGLYLEAKGRVLPLENLYRRAIAPMEGRDMIDGKERVPRDRYQWPLVGAILSALLALFLVDAKSPRRGSNKAVRAKARGGGAMSTGKAVAVLAVTLVAGTLLACSEDASAAKIEPWNGSLSDAVRTMDEMVEEGVYAEALHVADRVLVPGTAARLRERLDRMSRGASESVLGPLSAALDALGVYTITSEERGQIEFARALVHLASIQESSSSPNADPEELSAHLEAAKSALTRAIGAHGSVRPGALEALGDIELAQGEAMRALIPEIAGASGLPGGPGPPGGAAGAGTANSGTAEPDFLSNAREAYQSARARFRESFGAGAASEAARGNSELCVRRLEELDRIEQERSRDESDPEEDKSEDGEEEKDEDGEQGDESDEDDSESEPSQDQESDSDEGEKEDESPQQEDPGSEQDDPSEDKSEEEEPQEPEETGEQEPSEPPDEEADEEADNAPEPTDEGEAIEEKHMTLEELERLLEENRNYQRHGEEQRLEARKRRRIPTKRDW